MVGYFKELALYSKYIENLKIKCLKNINFLSELPFYEELNVIKQIVHSEDMQQDAKLN